MAACLDDKKDQEQWFIGLITITRRARFARWLGISPQAKPSYGTSVQTVWSGPVQRMTLSVDWTLSSKTSRGSSRPLISSWRSGNEREGRRRLTGTRRLALIGTYFGARAASGATARQCRQTPNHTVGPSVHPPGRAGRGEPPRSGASTHWGAATRAIRARRPPCPMCPSPRPLVQGPPLGGRRAIGTAGSGKPGCGGVRIPMSYAGPWATLVRWAIRFSAQCARRPGRPIRRVLP
jgi:hypothetical protein